ncbi:MAG TPA: hypothetical protein VM779_00350 [Thermoanaerobaculia bacterium]|nr:hypothetical protein [Thermoanaerobaculia bacterium]
MAKKTGKRTSRSAISMLRRAASSLADALTRRGGRQKQAAVEATSDRAVPRQQPRRTRRESDIPLDRLANEYTPTQTSLKAGFRASGDDRQRDQEFAGGADERWNDEDHYTNHSGDPRIGTHGRTYEPGEK